MRSTVGATEAVRKSCERAVLAEAVQAGGENGPTAAREHSRREHVGTAEDQKDNEDPKAVVAIHTIHSFSSLFAAEYVVGFPAVILSHPMARQRKMFRAPFI